MAKLKSKIKLINILIAAENVMCVYRNFFMLNDRERKLAIARVIAASLIYLASLVNYNIFAYERFDEGNIMLFIFMLLYNILTTVLTMENIIFGIRRSIVFKTIISSIDFVHECCNNIKPSVYPQALRKLAVRSIIIIVVLLITCVSMLVNVLITTRSLLYLSKTRDYIIIAVNAVLMIWKEVQFYAEILLFNVLIGIITIAMKQINAKLTKSTQMIDKRYNDFDNINDECKLLRNNIREFVPIFNCLKVCVSKLKQCFGIQVLFSLFNPTLFYIFLVYRGISMIKEQGSGGWHVITILQLFNYTGAIFSVLYTGQMALNAMEALRRSLSLLHVQLLTIPGPEALSLRKPVRGFLRQMATEPVAVNVLSKLPVQMALLLQILTTIISYTIVFLQFNHVV